MGRGGVVVNCSLLDMKMSSLVPKEDKFTRAIPKGAVLHKMCSSKNICAVPNGILCSSELITNLKL